MWGKKQTCLTLVSLPGKSCKVGELCSGLSEGNMKEMGGWWEIMIWRLNEKNNLLERSHGTFLCCFFVAMTKVAISRFSAQTALQSLLLE